MVHSIWGTSLVALLSVGSLVDWNFRNVAPALGPTVALLIIFTISTPRPESSPRTSRLYRVFSSIIPVLDIHEIITSLAWRMTIILFLTAAGDIYLFGQVEIEVASTLSLGLSKAIFWYFTIQTLRSPPSYDKLSLSSPIPLGSLSPSPPTRPLSWRIASAIATFGLLSASDPFTQLTDANALATAVAALLTLTQVVILLPKDSRWKRLLWAIFALVPVAPFVANIAAIHGYYPAPPHTLAHHEHPVEALMRNAKGRFDTMLQRQSQNVTAASNEYRQRYGIEPPADFGSWFNFAHQLGSPIVDEFDMIHSILGPLRVFSGKDIQRAIQTVYNLPDSEVWRCTYTATTRKTTCTHPSRTFDRHVGDMFNALLGGGSFGGGVPKTTVELDVDVTFLVNHLDEPRVLLPADIKPDDKTRLQYTVTNLDRKPLWDILTQHCAAQQRISENTTAETSSPVDTFGIPFVTDTHISTDPCRHSEYKDMHGMVTSPVSFPLIQGLVPILSSGALSTMGDILYPSPAYSEAEFVYDAQHDVPWDKKKNTLYWAGSTTGAYAEDTKKWRGFHRQRVVALAQNLEHKQHAYLTDQRGPVHRVWSPFLNGRLFDIAFTRVFQCDHRACRAQRSFFRPRPWAGRDDAMRSRLVFGVDGNGISGRYYKLLASGSAPLKQTLLREWHDERLAPWVHYFPVSQGMEELPELVSYLTSRKGERAARAVAENGQHWSQQALRPADRAVYVYRLLLELARLQDPNRPAGSASVPISA